MYALGVQFLRSLSPRCESFSVAKSSWTVSSHNISWMRADTVCKTKYLIGKIHVIIIGFLFFLYSTILYSKILRIDILPSRLLSLLDWMSSVFSGTADTVLDVDAPWALSFAIRQKSELQLS